MSFNIYRDGKVHVVRDMCSTCIFRTGNLMHLAEGRRDQLVREAITDDTAIVCHSTIGASENAVCRGFFDHHTKDTTCLRLALACGVIEFDAPRKLYE
jgi:hypothetical protein